MNQKKQGFGPGPGRVYEELRPIAKNTVLDGTWPRTSTSTVPITGKY